jgi:hypothetical protein
VQLGADVGAVAVIDGDVDDRHALLAEPLVQRGQEFLLGADPVAAGSERRGVAGDVVVA